MVFAIANDLEGVVGLSSKEREALSVLDNHDFSHLEERMVGEGKYFSDSDEFGRALEEFKKYFSIVGGSDISYAMTSPAVDEIWHQEILFSRDYFELSEKVHGGYLHHNPATSENKITKSQVDAFRDAYESKFGDLPGIWNLEDYLTSPCDGCSASDGGCSS